MDSISHTITHWTAPHPAWNERQDWPRDVSSFVIVDDERCVFVDPLDTPEEAIALVGERTPVVLLTCPWHARSGEQLAERLGVQLIAPPADDEDPEPLDARVYRAGDEPIAGVRAFAGLEPNDLVLWFEHERTLVAGDTLIDRGSGLEYPTDWAAKHGDAEAIHAQLLELLELPVERVLLTHGGAYDRAALRRALEQPVAARQP